MREFSIVTAVTPEYLKKFRWCIASWTVKPQFANRKLHVFHSGFSNPEKDLAFIGELFEDVECHDWKMEAKVDQRELMLSCFVLGAARVVKEPFYVKLDADCYFTDSQDAFLPEDFQVDLCAHRWGYTKPGWWYEKLKKWVGNNDWNGDKSNVGSIGHKRIISWCCLHRTEFVKNVAKLTPERLPIPSHDSYLWFMADNFPETKWKAVNLKSRGVGHASRWKTIREEICANPSSRNPYLDNALVRNVQIEITTACNLACHNCDRNCGTAKTSELVTVEQIKKFVDESIRLDKKWGRIDIIGGEPTIHQQFWKVLDTLYVYKNWSKRTKFRITTNGHGDFVKKQIKRMEDTGYSNWIQIRNTAKLDNVHDFTAVNMAPIDEGVKDVLKCSIPWRCGTALTRYGYFSCGAGASIARVFGLDIGIKSLEDYTPENLHKQMSILCGYCGHSRSRGKEPLVRVQCTSKSWEKAYEDYKEKELALY